MELYVQLTSKYKKKTCAQIINEFSGLATIAFRSLWGTSDTAVAAIVVGILSYLIGITK